MRSGRPPPRRARPGAGLANAAPLRERRWELLALAQYRAGPSGRGAAHHRPGTPPAASTSSGSTPGPDSESSSRPSSARTPTSTRRRSGSSASDGLPLPRPAAVRRRGRRGLLRPGPRHPACLERLDAEGVLAVLGPSGSGKSPWSAPASSPRSAAKASTATSSPRAAPVGALPPPRPTGKPRLLVVDQAEELFSLCDDQEEQRRFVQLLADHAEAAPLVLVLRADRMGDVSAHPVFARLVERGLYVLAAMTADELAPPSRDPPGRPG